MSNYSDSQVHVLVTRTYIKNKRGKKTTPGETHKPTDPTPKAQRKTQDPNLGRKG